MTPDSQQLALGADATHASDLARSWDEADFCGRLWAADHSLWTSEPAPEISDRLGWLDLPETMPSALAEIEDFAASARGDGVDHVVVLGMGGSSLAPEVFAATFEGGVRLSVLDSTHPGAVAALAESIDVENTLFIVASKSGTTIEPLSFFEYFWDLTEHDGSRFIAITDPGTPLVALATERNFRATFEATPDVGGRYSALTAFGLVPAALIGAPVVELLGSAGAMRRRAKRCGEEPLILGAALATMATRGRDKATFICSPAFSSFPAWAEQLVAESTGKSGVGIVPIAGERLAAPDRYGDDRVFIYLALDGDSDAAQAAAVDALEAAGQPVIRIHLTDRAALGGEMFRAEFAVAVASAGLGIHPFNQPDVQAAKELARRAMGGADLGDAPSVEPDRAPAAIEDMISLVGPGDYVALLAFLEPTAETTAALEAMRLHIRDRTRAATTLGFGPRYLHSTGQLHKGGPNTGVFIQFVDRAQPDIPVPNTDYSFGQLIAAQAAGDHAALLGGGRRVLRIDLDTASSLAEISAALGTAPGNS